MSSDSSISRPLLPRARSARRNWSAASGCSLIAALPGDARPGVRRRGRRAGRAPSGRRACAAADSLSLAARRISASVVSSASARVAVAGLLGQVARRAVDDLGRAPRAARSETSARGLARGARLVRPRRWRAPSSRRRPAVSCLASTSVAARKAQPSSASFCASQAASAGLADVLARRAGRWRARSRSPRGRRSCESAGTRRRRWPSRGAARARAASRCAAGPRRRCRSSAAAKAANSAGWASPMRLRQLPVVDPHRQRVALGRGLRRERGEAVAVVAAQRVAGVDDGASRRPGRRPGAAAPRRRRRAASDERRERRASAARSAPRRGRLIYWIHPICCPHPRPASLREHRARAERPAPRPSALPAARCGPACSPSARPSSAPPPPRPRAPPWPITSARRLFRLEPDCLGLYWPLGSEFNAAAALAADPRFDKTARWRCHMHGASPRAMEFRRWDGAAPTLVDECGIGSSDGARGRPRRRRRALRRLHRRGPSARLRRRLLRPLARRASRTSSRSASPGRSPRSTLATFAAQPHDVAARLRRHRARRALALAPAQHARRLARRPPRASPSPRPRPRRVNCTTSGRAAAAGRDQHPVRERAVMRPAAPNGSTSSPRCSASKTSGTRASATPWPASAACTCW